MNYLSQRSRLLPQPVAFSCLVFVRSIYFIEKTMSTEFETFLLHSRSAKTPDELFSVYSKFLDTCGFNRVGYAIISDHDDLKQDNPLGLINNVNLDHWAARYLERNYVAIDPMFEATYHRSGIYVWQNFCQTQNLSTAQKNFFNEAFYEAQLFQGATFAIHGTGGSKGALLACTDEPMRKINPQHYDLVNLASYQYHTCYLDLMDFRSAETSPLTVRESAVLQWAATGLTKTGIGDQMNISEHTVDYHTRNAMRKLNAKNTTAALVTAIKKGYIEP